MSFLRDYITFSSGNESPTVFHQWSALSTLSSLISRRVWVDCGIFTTYPNMYILLVGNAGIKKSTAMSISRRMIRELQTIPIAPPSITKEALTEFMAEEDSPCSKNFKHTDSEGKESLRQYTHLSIFSNELVTLLNAGGNAMGMIDFLTDIWDQDVFEVKTKNKGHDHITGPYITILGCLTTETMNNLMNTRIISSGFSRRCMFIYSDDIGTPVPRPIVTDAQKAAWDRCIQRAKHIQTLSGEFQWTPDAEAFWDAWYTSNHLRKGEEEIQIRKGFLQTKPEYVLKLAMLITISDAESLELTQKNLELAVSFIDQVEPSMGLVFEGAGRNELSPVASAIRQMIESSSLPVPVSKVYATFYSQADTKELDDILEHLQRTNVCKLLKITKGQRELMCAAKPDFELGSGQPGQQPGDVT